MMQKSLTEIARELGIPESTALYWSKRLPSHFSKYELDGTTKLYDYEETKQKLEIIRGQQHINNKLKMKDVESVLNARFTPIIEVNLDHNNNTTTTQQQHNEIMVNHFNDNLILKALESIGKLSDFTEQVRKLEDENARLKEEIMKLSAGDEEIRNNIAAINDRLNKARENKSFWQRVRGK